MEEKHFLSRIRKKHQICQQCWWKQNIYCEGWLPNKLWSSFLNSLNSNIPMSSWFLPNIRIYIHSFISYQGNERGKINHTDEKPTSTEIKEMRWLIFTMHKEICVLQGQLTSHVPSSLYNATQVLSCWSATLLDENGGPKSIWLCRARKSNIFVMAGDCIFF